MSLKKGFSFLEPALWVLLIFFSTNTGFAQTIAPQSSNPRDSEQNPAYQYAEKEMTLLNLPNSECQRQNHLCLEKNMNQKERCIQSSDDDSSCYDLFNEEYTKCTSQLDDCLEKT